MRGDTRGGRRAARAGALAATVFGCALLAGCGGSTGAAAPSPSPTAPAAAPQGPGPFLGLCGSVSDDELAQVTGMAPPLRVVRDPVGCQWDVGTLGDGTHVSFTWYRGSPIGRERSIDGAVGRQVSDVTVDGHPGFLSRTGTGLCEAGVSYGGDFFLWSLDFSATAAPPQGDACDAATRLATMTAERAR